MAERLRSEGAAMAERLRSEGAAMAVRLRRESAAMAVRLRSEGAVMAVRLQREGAVMAVRLRSEGAAMAERLRKATSFFRSGTKKRGALQTGRPAFLKLHLTPPTPPKAAVLAAQSVSAIRIKNLQTVSAIPS